MALPDHDPDSASTNAHLRLHVLGPVDADPSTSDVNDGTVWYNTAVDELRVLKDGTIHNVTTSAA